MPYLLLDFSAEDQEVKFSDRGKQKIQPKGTHHIVLKMIDTDTGKVVELEADSYNLKHEERSPKWGETHTAGQVLGKDPGHNVSQAQFDQLVSERDSYKRKLASVETAVDQKKKIIDDLEGEIAKMKTRDFDDETREFLADALEVRIEELGMSENPDAYMRAKKIFRRLTGRSWVNDDDEEGDLAGSDIPLHPVDFWHASSESTPLADIQKMFDRMLVEAIQERLPPVRFFVSSEDVSHEFSYLYGFSYTDYVFTAGRRSGKSFFTTEMMESARELLRLQVALRRVDANLKKLARQIRRKNKKRPTQQDRQQWRHQQRRMNRQKMPGR